MEVVPVVDLLAGKAVRAVGGRRGEYRPWSMPHLADDSLRAMARFYRETFGFTSLYLADLDALADRSPPAWDLLAPLLDDGWKLQLDAGLRSADQLAEWLPRSVAGRSIDWIVPLEAFSFASGGSAAARDDLRRCVDLVGPDRLTFSLDLLDGRPLFHGWNASVPAEAAGEGNEHSAAVSGLSILAEAVGSAAEAGVRRWIVLDLASVGGKDGGRSDGVLAWMRSLPVVERLTAGGGVRGLEDLRRLHAAGCDAVLAATALHEGTVTPEDVQAARNFVPMGR